MNNVALGQYMPLDSVVHKMDPRSKIMIMLFLMVAIFIPAGVLGYVIIGIFILLSLYLSKLNIKYALRTMKPMLWMMAFLLVINLLVIKTGTPLFSIKGFTIYSDAVNQTLYIVVRLMLMVIITTVLTATTKPLDLTLGIEKLLKPFEKIGVPSRKNPNPKYLILLDLDTLLFVIFALSPSFFSMNLDTLVMPLSTTFELATKITQSFA